MCLGTNLLAGGWWFAENGDLPIENGTFIYWLGTNFRWFDSD